MTTYWKDRYNVLAEKFADAPLRQVERTVNGQEVSDVQMNLAIDAVVQSLNLQLSDCVADLCCGNGLITRAVAPRVRAVTGVDFSEGLIHYARQHSVADNIHYEIADVSRLPSKFFHGMNKVYLRDSVSCLDTESLSRLLHAISQSGTVEKFHIGGVPDAGKLSVYYDTDEKMAYYQKLKAEGIPHIGTWWGRDEFIGLVEAQGLTASICEQSEQLTCAYYRFDCLIGR